ncbi:MAG: hypothetical protein R2715_15610 [Ilumatobacteraceae bacterium]
MTRADDRAELELDATRVEGGQAHERLHHRHLALADDEHRNELDANQEGIEQIGAVQQRVVLQTDPATGLQEGLEVLIVVVQLVLVAEEHLDGLGVRGAARLEGEHVVVGTEPAGDVTARERLALQRRHDADHVLLAVGGDDGDLQLLGRQPERGAVELVAASERGELGRHGQAIDRTRGDHREADRMDRQQGARGEDRALHALLAAVLDERADVGEVAERRVVASALGTDRQRPTHLGDDHTDLPRRNLHPRELAHGVDRPQLEAEARHQELGLIAGLAGEGDGIVVVEPLAGEPLVDQTDLGRAHHRDGPQDDDEEQRGEDRAGDEDGPHERDHDDCPTVLELPRRLASLWEVETDSPTRLPGTPLRRERGSGSVIRPRRSGRKQNRAGERRDGPECRWEDVRWIVCSC